MSMSEERKQGTVKWFSNKKGYGFITPKNEAEDDIFCHQSVVHSEGYRTLGEGWEVEYSIEYDDDGKAKAENVTAVGGGPCSGPRGVRRRRRRKPDELGERVPQVLWHEGLSDDVKEKLDQKGIARVTGTIDLAVGGLRIKLGTRNYAALAQDDRTIAEGSFECDEEGQGEISFQWKKAIRFGEEGGWEQIDLANIVSNLHLADEIVEAVGQEETMATLMGEETPDPRGALEAAGFEMRRVVLCARRR